VTGKAPHNDPAYPTAAATHRSADGIRRNTKIAREHGLQDERNKRLINDALIGPITLVMQHAGRQVTWLPDEIVGRDEYKDWVFTMDWPDENGDMSQTRFFRGRRPRGSYTVRRPGTGS
jgi:hypothetical protein